MPLPDHASDVTAALTRLLKERGVEVRLHGHRRLVFTLTVITAGGQYQRPADEISLQRFFRI